MAVTEQFDNSSQKVGLIQGGQNSVITGGQFSVVIYTRLYNDEKFAPRIPNEGKGNVRRVDLPFASNLRPLVLPLIVGEAPSFSAEIFETPAIIKKGHDVIIMSLFLLWVPAKSLRAPEKICTNPSRQS